MAREGDLLNTLGTMAIPLRDPVWRLYDTPWTGVLDPSLLRPEEWPANTSEILALVAEESLLRLAIEISKSSELLRRLL